VENGEEARISKPSDDVSCGNSWHDFDESSATTTRPEPDRAVAHFGGLVYACYEKVEEGAVRKLQKEKYDGRN
jgi:hypothetical protein